MQSKGAGNSPYVHWTRRASELWPTPAAILKETTGVDTGLRQPGGLMFCLSDEELEKHAAIVHRMHNESGDIGTRMLDRNEVHAMVPGLGDRVVGASFRRPRLAALSAATCPSRVTLAGARHSPRSTGRGTRRLPLPALKN